MSRESRDIENEKQMVPEAGGTLLGRFSRVIDRASKEELEFLEELVVEWNVETYNVMESAFMHSANAFNVSWLGSPDTLQYLARFRGDLEEFFRIFSYRRGWLADLLSTMMAAHRGGHLQKNPEAVLGFVEEEMREYRVRVEGARELLADNPGVLEKEIRAAVRKKPDLLAEE